MAEDIRSIDSSDTGTEIVEVRLCLSQTAENTMTTEQATLLPVIRNGGANTYMNDVVLALSGSVSTITVPATARGVWFMPTSELTDSPPALYWSTDAAGPWMQLSSLGFNLFCFDKASLPASIFLKQAVSTTSTLTIQLIWL